MSDNLDNLDHDFAGAVLLTPEDQEAIDAAIKKLLPDHPTPFQVFYYCHDVDVPIPFIYQFDTATRLELPKGELYANLSGEAFDRTYHLKVEVRLPKEGTTFGYEGISVVNWPEMRGEAGLGQWKTGWQAAEQAGLELPTPQLRIPLISAMFDVVYAEDLEKILSPFT